MPITISFDAIKNQLTNETLILTPNSRTQKAIVAGYVQSLNEGDVVYAPNVKSFSQWQTEIWQELSFICPLPKIIDPLVLKTWLKELIAKEENWQLTNELGVAQKVLEGYRILKQWNLDLSHLELPDFVSSLTVENQYFKQWIFSLESFFDKNNFIANFCVGNYLVTQINTIVNFFPKEILLVGFNQWIPCEKKLIDCAIENGTKVNTYYPQRSLQNAKRIELNNFKGELEFAAKKAFQLTGQNPRASIGIVVHQLANEINQVHDVFSQQFQPEEQYPWQTIEKTHYNVSAGQALSELPLVNAALKILQFKSNGFDLETLQFLKNSPFIDWQDNKNEICHFIHEQCLLGYANYSLDWLMTKIEEANNTQKLQLLFQRLQALKNRPFHSRPMNAWIKFWQSELQQWGVSKQQSQEQQFNDIELKILSEFDVALDKSAALGDVISQCSQQQAKEFLLQVLKQQSFQMPSDRTNVHVLGILEATGLEFDNLILVGFDRKNWPQKAKLNPFLPVTLQQKYDMPGSSAEKEYEYTHDLSQSLLNSANNLWITQSLQNDELSGESLLFSHIPLANYSSEKAIQKVLNSDYKWITDETIDISDTQITGGAYLLSQYAACPFKAMSHFQFKVRPNQVLKKGIDPRTRGSWLHKALELFWQEIQTQKKLLQLSENEISNIVQEKVEQAKEKYTNQLYANTARAVVNLEHEKIHRLIIEWLNIEKKREDFSVYDVEVEKKLSLGNLSFSFYIDRIDVDEKNNIMIIDYKTGSTDYKKWLGKRPEESQMPAYALSCYDRKIASLTYATLKTGEVSQKGIWFDNDNPTNNQFLELSEDKIKDGKRYIEKLVDLKHSLTEQWKDNLQNLAYHIEQGDMPVSPKHVINTCKFCDYADFCRINENQPLNKLGVET